MPIDAQESLPLRTSPWDVLYAEWQTVTVQTLSTAGGRCRRASSRCRRASSRCHDGCCTTVTEVFPPHPSAPA